MIQRLPRDNPLFARARAVRPRPIHLDIRGADPISNGISIQVLRNFFVPSLSREVPKSFRNWTPISFFRQLLEAFAKIKASGLMLLPDGASKRRQNRSASNGRFGRTQPDASTTTAAVRACGCTSASRKKGRATALRSKMNRTCLPTRAPVM
jgi:hypothetical protein